MSAAPARFTSGGRGHDTRNGASVTKEAAMEKLGVIGGMGAEATSYYYDQVVRHTAAACDQEHIDMVVLSKSTMPDRTLAIKTGECMKLLPGPDHQFREGESIYILGENKDVQKFLK